jgi:hypothetical protein
LLIVRDKVASVPFTLNPSSRPVLLTTSSNPRLGASYQPFERARPPRPSCHSRALRAWK